MKPKPFPLPVLIDLLTERIEVAQQYEKVAGIGCLGELLPQAVEHLERLRAIDGTPRPIVIAPKPPPIPTDRDTGTPIRDLRDLPEPSFWRTFLDNWRRRRAERNDARDLQGETIVNELGRMAR